MTSSHASGGIGTCTGSIIRDEDTPNSYTHHDSKVQVAKAKDQEMDFSLTSLKRINSMKKQTEISVQIQSPIADIKLLSP